LKDQVKNSVGLSATGDIMLGRKIAEKVNKSDLHYPFSKIRNELMKDSDVVFGNLESPLSNNGTPVKKMNSAPIFRGSPVFGRRLKEAGFNILNLANNHILDFGVKAAIDTIQLCNNNSIQTLGIGNSLLESREPVTYSKNDIEIKFLGYTYAYGAESNKFGCSPMIESLILKDIKKIKTSNDHIIVSLHGGLELIDYPNPSVRILCRKIIDQGATVVLRHHPHCLQGIEEYNGGLIAYSLGNFVFDQHFDENWNNLKSRHFLNKSTKLANRFLVQNKVRESYILKCQFDHYGMKSYNIIPIIINDNFEPEVATGIDKKRISNHLENISSPLYNENNCIWKTIDSIYTNLYRTKLINYIFQKIWRIYKVRPKHIKIVFQILKEQFLFRRKRVS